MTEPYQTPIVPRHQRSQRPRLRRARIACTNCHRRKVRCNVESDGIPCINCHLDGCECITIRKHSKSSTARTDFSTSAAPYDENTYNENITEHLTRTSNSTSFAPTEDKEIDDEILFAPMTIDEATAISPDQLKQKSLQRKAQAVPRDYGVLSMSLVSIHFSFLKVPNMRKLQPADVAYLESQKCLHVPSGPFLEILLSHYFLYVHPCLPVINEAEFWKMFRQNEHVEPSFSLLVLQAMLFVASSFIPLHIAKEHGGQSILDIRNMYYRRAKLLYDFGVEEDPLRLSEAAVLLSFQSCRTDQLGNTIWLSLAIQHARVANAHLYYRYHDQGRSKQVSLKRLWWSIILRDRIIAIGMRRPIQVLPDHFNPLLRDPLLLEDLEDEMNASEIYDRESKEMLCRILTSQCELASVLTPLIMMVYPPSGTESLETDFETKLFRINDIKARLEYWDANQVVQILSHQNVHASVAFYAQLTSLYYESARLALLHYIPLCQYSQSRCHSNQPVLDQSWRKNQSDLIKVLTTINGRIKRFIVDGTASYLPISVVAYTVTPQILLNINLRLADNKLERQRQERFLTFYTELRRVYYLRYDVSHVDNWIDQVLGMFESSALHYSSAGPSISEQTCSSPVHQMRFATSRTFSTAKSFSEFLETRPTLYLQLLKIMDYSLSTGRDVLSSPSRSRLCFSQASSSSPGFFGVPFSPSWSLSFPGMDKFLATADGENVSDRAPRQPIVSTDSSPTSERDLRLIPSRSTSDLQERTTSTKRDADEHAINAPYFDSSLSDVMDLNVCELLEIATSNRANGGTPGIDELWTEIALFGE